MEQERRGHVASRWRRLCCAVLWRHMIVLGSALCCEEADLVGEFAEAVHDPEADLVGECSRQVLARRLFIFWRNVLKVRLIHNFLYAVLKLWRVSSLVMRSHRPEAVPRIIAFDEKPMWFTSAANSKTLALRGSAQVAVKENVAATRTRFTAMTRSDGAGQ